MKTSGTPRRILLVEVNPDTAQSLTSLLRDMGYDVRIAIDAQSAREAAGAEALDMVLLDVGLADGDGWTLAREIRSRHRVAPIVSMSRSGSEQDKRRSFDAGCDYHLAKPLNLPYLQKLLFQL